jgi:hypothetical protein
MLLQYSSRLLSGYGLGRNSVIANIYFNVAKMLLPNFILFRGSKIYPDSENSIQLAMFGYRSEEYELTVFKSELESSLVVLDIGANIGVYTLTAARYADKVYSFEPVPISFLDLKKNVKVNYYKNVFTVNKAVSDKTGHAQFSFSSKKNGQRQFPSYK